ncbi:MAG: choice-of-anchor D domain-containing protein [Opitutales bacterium]|nr:choice-of-anchor D domain-containing protein [Opitutales bacterium]
MPGTHNLVAALDSPDGAGVDPAWIEANLAFAFDAVRLGADAIAFLQQQLPGETALIGQWTQTWEALQIPWIGVAEARRAWWQLGQYAEYLAWTAQRYGHGAGSAVETAFLASGAQALGALETIAGDLTTLFDGLGLEAFAFPLPGDLVVDRLFGRLSFNRLTEDWDIRFGGALRFPEINLAFAIDAASLASTGEFALALRTSGPAPFGFDDSLRLDIANTFSLGGNYLSRTLSNASATGTLTRQVAGGGPETYTLNLGYAYTPAPPPATDEGEHRFDFSLGVGGDLEVFTEDLVVFRGGLGFSLTVDADGQPLQGAFSASATVGILLKDGATEPYTPDDFELRLDGQALVTVSGEERSIALSGNLFLPEGYQALACGSPGTPDPAAGRPFAIIPVTEPLVFTYFTDEHADADLRGTVRTSATFSLGNLRFALSGFERLWLDVCSLELALAFDSAIRRPTGRLRELDAVANIPLPDGQNLRTAIKTADWSLNRLPTEGTIGLLEDLRLFSQGGFNLDMLGADPLGIPQTYIALFPADGEEPYPRLRIQGSLRAAAETWFTDEAGNSVSLASSAEAAALTIRMPPDRLPSLEEGDFIFDIAAIEFGCAPDAPTPCELRFFAGVAVVDPRIRITNPLRALRPTKAAPFEVEMDLAFKFNNVGGPELTLGGQKFALVFDGSPDSPLVRFDTAEACVDFTGMEGGALTPGSGFPLFVRRFCVGLKNLTGPEGVPLFTDDPTKRPAFSTDNLEFTISAGLQFGDGTVDAIIYGEVDELVVSFVNGEPTFSVDGIGIGVDFSYWLGKDFPFKGKVYLGGLQSDGFFVSGAVGANLKGNLIEGVAALNQDGPIGLCVGIAGAEISIPIYAGFTLTGAKGGLIRGVGTRDPCAFVTRYQINPVTGRPTGPPLPEEPDENGPPDPTGCPGYKASFADLERFRTPGERDELSLNAAQMEVVRRLVAETGMDDADARALAESADPEMIDDLNGIVDEIVTQNGLARLDFADLCVFDCPPPSLGPSAQMHPEAFVEGSPYEGRAIWKFTSVDESMLNFFGFNRAAVNALVPPFDEWNPVTFIPEFASRTAEEIRLRVERIVARPLPEAPGFLEKWIDGESVQVTFDQFLDEFLNQFELGLYNALNCNLHALTPAAFDRDELVDTIWEGLREAAYAGIPYEDVTLRLEGSFSYVVVDSFASVTGGVVYSPTNNTTGVYGSLNLLGIPTGYIEAFVATYDAEGNLNSFPALCGDLIGAFGPVELGRARFLLDAPGSTARILGAFDDLGNALTGPYVYERMLEIAPEKAIPGASPAEHLIQLATAEEKLAFINAVVARQPTPDTGVMYQAFRQWIIDLLNAVAPRMVYCDALQPKVFGFPLSGDNVMMSTHYYFGPEDPDTYGDHPVLEHVWRSAFSPFQMGISSVLAATGAGTLAAILAPSIDRAVFTFREQPPTLGTLFDEITSLPFNEFVDKRFRDFVASTSLTFEYELAPLGLELTRAGGRLLFPSYDHHPVGPEPLPDPVDRGLPSRRDLLLAALGETGSGGNRLGDPNWFGTAEEIAALFEGTDFAPVFEALPPAEHPRLVDDYFPHGGFLGAAAFGVPKLLSEGIPESFYTVIDPTSVEVLEWLAAVGEFFDYVTSTDPGGELSFYFPAPNPPAMLAGGFPASFAELLDDLRGFQFKEETLALYPLERTFLAARWNVPLFGVPVASGLLEADFESGSFRFRAQSPVGHWITDFIDAALPPPGGMGGEGVLQTASAGDAASPLRATLSLGPDATLPVSELFDELRAGLDAIAPLQPGATPPYTAADYLSLPGPADTAAFLETVTGALSRRLPRAALAYEGALGIPAWLADFVRPAADLGGGAEIELFAFTPMYEPDYTPDAPHLEDAPYTLARRQGGIGFRGSLELGYFPAAFPGTELAVNVEEASFLVLAGATPGLPRVVAALDVPAASFPFGGFDFSDVRVALDTQPAPGDHFLRVAGRTLPPGLPGIFEVESSAPDGRVGGEVVVAGGGVVTLRFAPVTAVMPLLGGLSASVTGFEEDGAFTFSTVPGEDWGMAFTLDGALQLRDPLDPLSGAVFLEVVPDPGQPAFQATLTGTGLETYRLVLQGGSGGHFRVFPGTPHETSFDLPTGDGFTLFLDNAGRFYADFGVIGGVGFPGAISASARLEFGHNPDDPRPEVVLRKDNAPFAGPLAFGTVNLAQSTVNAFQIRNAGLKAANISLAVEQAAAADDFTLATGALQIEPGGERTIELVFQPKAAGTRSATLRIFSNDPLNPVQTLALTGGGLQEAIYAPSRPNINFGDTLVGATSTSTFTVANPGSAALSILSVSTSGAAFAVSPTGAVDIPAGGSQSYTVAFEPGSSGPAAGSLNINARAPIGLQTVSLSGNGAESRWVTLLDAATAGRDDTLNDLKMIDVNEGFAVGNGGAFLQTLDGGRSWIPRVITRENLRAITYESGNLLQTAVAIHHFDEPPDSTVYLDASGNGRHGVVDSDPAKRPDRSFIHGRFGAGLRFDGVDDIGEIGVFALPNSFSISLWARFNSTSGDQTLLGKYSTSGARQFKLRLSANGTYRVRFAGTNLSFPAAPTALEWTHILVTGTYSSINDQTTVRLYENNVLRGTQVINGATNQSTLNRWRIGALWHPTNGESQHFNGSLDELMIFSGVLSAANRTRLFTTNLDRMVVAGDGGRVYESYARGRLWAQHPEIEVAGWNTAELVFEEFDYHGAAFGGSSPGSPLYLTGRQVNRFGNVGRLAGVEGIQNGRFGTLSLTGAPFAFNPWRILTDVSHVGGTMRATGADGVLYTQELSGGHAGAFAASSPADMPALNAVAAHGSGASQYVAVGVWGRIRRENTEVASGTGTSLHAVTYRSNVSPAYHAVGHNGTYLTSANLGANWQVVQDGLEGTYRAIDTLRVPGSFSAANYHVWTAGDAHRIEYRPPAPVTGPFLTFFPGKLDFGFVLTGESEVRELRLRNRGKQALQITGLVIEGPAAGRFSLAQSSLGTIPGEGDLPLRVRYRPTTASTLDHAELVVSTNDPGRPVFRIPLEGRAGYRDWRPVVLEADGAPVAGTVHSVRFTSPSRGYALVTPVLGDSLLYRTNDAGATWQLSSFGDHGGTLRLESLDAIRHSTTSAGFTFHNDHIFAVGRVVSRGNPDRGILLRASTSIVLYSVPNFTERTPVPSGQSTQPLALTAVSALSHPDGILLSTATTGNPANANLWTSANEGLSWFVSDSRPDDFDGGPVRQHGFLSGGFPGTFWNLTFAATGPKLYFRINAIGATPGGWDNDFQVVQTPGTIRDLHILDNVFFFGVPQALSWVVGDGGTFLTWNGNLGTPWRPARDAEVFGTTDLSAIHSTNLQNVWVVGESRIFDSRDRGLTWKLSFDAGDAAALTSVHSLDGSQAWAGGSLDGRATIWRYLPPPPVGSRVLRVADYLDWGDVTPGAGASRILTLTNTGTTSLPLHDLRIESDEGIDRFRIGGLPPASLAPGASHNLTLHFDALEAPALADDLEPAFFLRFENEWGATRFTDDSPNARHANAALLPAGSRPTLALSGLRDRALRFDGAQYLTLNENPGPNALPSSYAVSLWVAPDNNSGTQVLLAKDAANGSDLLNIALTPGGVRVRIRQSTITGGGTPPTGWHHLAVNFVQLSPTLTAVTVYRNGQPVFQNTVNAILGDAAGQPWILGAEFSSASATANHFTGSLDDVMLVPRALTLSEIRRLAAKSPLYGEHRARLVIDSGSDADSLETTLRAVVAPAPRVVTLNTQPQGLPVIVNGVTHPAPVSFAIVPFASSAAGAHEWIEGSVQRISVAPTASLPHAGGGIDYAFAGWSHAAGPEFDLAATHDTPAALTAAFVPVAVNAAPVDPPPPSGPPGPDPLLTALANAPQGPFLRLSNGTLRLPNLGGTPFAITGELLLSPARIEGQLSAPAASFPENAPASLLEVGAASWRLEAVAGVSFLMEATLPSLRVLGYLAAPEGLASLAFTPGTGGDPGHWQAGFVLKQDLKPVPGMLEFKKGAVALGWSAAPGIPAFHLGLHGGFRLLQLPGGAFALDRDISVSVNAGDFDVGLNDLFAAAGQATPGVLFQSGPFRLDWTDLRLKRSGGGPVFLELQNTTFRFNGLTVATVGGSLGTDGSLGLSGNIGQNGTLRLEPNGRLFLRNSNPGAAAFQLDLAPGGLALDTPALRLETTATGATGNVLPNGVNIPAIRFNSNGSFDTGRLPLPALDFDGIAVSGPSGGSLTQNHIRLRRDSAGKATFSLKARQSFFGCQQRLSLSITADGAGPALVTGSMRGNFCVLPKSLSLQYNSANACQFSGAAFGFTVYFGSACVGVRNDLSGLCLLGACP